MQTKQGKPTVLALLPHTAASMVTGTPMVEKFKDGGEVLLRGPRPRTLADLVEPVPAEVRAQEERLPVVWFTARQLLTVAQGGTVATATIDGAPVLVRLLTPIEAMVLNREAIVAVDAMMRDAGHSDWEGPPPLDYQRAKELAQPLDAPAAMIREIVRRADRFTSDTRPAG
jgi:hypothetical protein